MRVAVLQRRLQGRDEGVLFQQGRREEELDLREGDEVSTGTGKVMWFCKGGKGFFWGEERDSNVQG
jgi:hypothetical protein